MRVVDQWRAARVARGLPDGTTAAHPDDGTGPMWPDYLQSTRGWDRPPATTGHTAEDRTEERIQWNHDNISTAWKNFARLPDPNRPNGGPGLPNPNGLNRRLFDDMWYI